MHENINCWNAVEGEGEAGINYRGRTILHMFLSFSVKVKVKVKFSLEQTMKDQRGRRGIALLFL
jgi:hypothetical protein